MGYGQLERLTDIVEKEAEEEEQQQEEEQAEDIDLTPHKHEIALKGACKSFVMPVKLKTDIDSYLDPAKQHIGTLIE